jgi:hypothetical protein
VGARQFMVAAFVVVGLVLPARVQAQEAPRGFVGGLGGLTFGTVTSGAVAAQGGVRLAPGVMLIGEIGYMRNVMPTEVQDTLDALVESFELVFGVPIELEVSVPSTYGFGGLRWTPRAGKVAPFIEGGVGVGRLSVKFDKAVVLGEDVSDLIDDELDSEDTDVNKFLFAVGGGVTIQVSPKVATDVGYRYTRIATDDPAVNASLIYAAVKLGF